jgi:FkbM family methyltransferase
MTIMARFGTSLGLARSLVVYYAQPWRRLALKRFYGNLIRPGDLVFDIGAHVGSRTKTLLSLGAHVVAVEPQPAFADFIESRFKGRLRAFERVAVGNAEGEIDLLISSRHPTVTSISPRFVETVMHAPGFAQVVWDQKVIVPMVTLDQLIARHGLPVFCKIDVEGAEAEILEGLNTPIALIAFEYLPAMPSILSQSIDRLMTLGNYRFNRVIGESHRFVGDAWITGEEMLKELGDLPADTTSGDIYARLVSR